MIYSLVGKVLAVDPSSAVFPGDGIKNPLRFDTLIDLLIAVAGWLFYIAIPIVTIMILYGAFQMITASGNPEQFVKGKKTILYAIIGFVIALIAGGIPDLIKQLF